MKLLSDDKEIIATLYGTVETVSLDQNDKFIATIKINDSWFDRIRIINIPLKPKEQVEILIRRK